MDLVQGESNDSVIYEITPYAAASSNSPPACGFFYEQAGQAGVWIVTGLIAGMQDPDKSDQDQTGRLMLHDSRRGSWIDMLQHSSLQVFRKERFFAENMV
jgi:hypothetical protein